MLRTFVSELTSVVNSDSAWKVSKGRRSTTRRARNIVGKGTENCAGVIRSNTEHSNMPESESEKRGVSELGCDKVEHVPIKKRRFLLRTSPPPPPSSPTKHDFSVSATKETTDLLKNQDSSNELVAKEPAFSEINSSQITDSNISDQPEKFEKASEILGDDEDFSGISILAAAACSSSLGKECGYAEERSCVEESSMQEQLHEICVRNKEPSLPRGFLKDDLVDSTEILTGGASSCVSTEPVGELLSLSTTVSSLQIVETVGRCIEVATPWAGSLTISRDVTCRKDEETVRNHSSSSRDDRLHWDLNVAMDDWEHSFEDTDAHNELSHKKSDEGEKYSDEDKREGPEGLGSRNILVTMLNKQNTLPLAEPGKLPVKASEVNKEDGKLPVKASEVNKEQSGAAADHNVSNPIRSDVNYHLPSCTSDLNHRESMVEDDYNERHIKSVSNVDKLVTSVLDDSCQLSESETINKGQDHSPKNLKLLGDGNNLCQLAFDVTSSLSGAPCELEKSGSDFSLGNVSAGTQTGFCILSNPDIEREVTPHLAGMDNVEASQTLLDDETASFEKIDLKASKPVQHSNVVESNEISLPCAEATDYESSKSEVLATSSKTQDISVSQSANLGETVSNDHEIKQVTNKETCDSLFSDFHKTNVDSNLCPDKNDIIEKHAHSDGAYLDCHSASMVGVNSASRLREDYDSQYEDGELRETNEAAWDEYRVGGEAEHMVCEEDMETCANSPTYYHVSESGQVDVERNVVMEDMSTIPSSVNNFENEGSRKGAEIEGVDGTSDGDKNKIKSNHLTEEKVDVPRLEELPEISKSSMEIGVRDDKERNVAAPKCDDVLVGTETKTEVKSLRRGLRSQIEAPVAQDGPYRDERLDRVQRRYEESSCMRSSERGRYPMHNQGRGRGHGSWNGSFDGRRGFKHRYSPTFQGQLKGDDDGIVEREDIRCIDSDSDAYAGIHSRSKPERKFSPDRPSTFGRERPFRYRLSDDSRGGRGRYNGPSKDEMFHSLLKYRRPLSHRERSLSPFGGRGHSNAYHSRGKSPSRSRSRSPLMLNSQRGRPGAGRGGNTFMRHRSRSPNFRPEVRVQRPRSPIHQPGFTADHTMGFRSFPRNNHSSPPRSRWTSGRRDESGHFRDFSGKQRSFNSERSPGRNIKRVDRSVGTDSLRNLKPDGYYRISEEGAGREFRYEESYEDRRKHYATLCPNRRSFEDGMSNRLHQEISDSFSGNSIRDRDTSDFQGRGMRGINCRVGDLPRLRGEHHSFIYERDGKFNSNSKQFVPSVMDSPSDIPSEEQYQSRPGRFPVVDGPSRGRRYESYEDKRKQHAVVFRRNEIEGTEKRLGHFIDRNFQDGPFFPRRSVRNFDGQIGSLSTRLGEHQESVVSRQEEKLEDNAQSFGGNNSDDLDTSKGRIAS